MFGFGFLGIALHRSGVCGFMDGMGSFCYDDTLI